MMYIKAEKNEIGAYPPPQKTKAGGLVILPDEMLETFLNYSGFVNIETENGIVTKIIPDEDAFNEWKERTEFEAANIEASDPQADTDAMLIDHEYRLTLLELGLTEEV